MLNFEMTSEQVDGGVLIRLRGDLDVQSVEYAREEMLRIEATDPEIMVIDLSRLSFLDSTGMGLVAAAQLRAIEKGTRFVLVRPRNPVDKAFLLTGYADVWETVGSAEEAFGGS